MSFSILTPVSVVKAAREPISASDNADAAIFVMMFFMF